MDRRGSSLLWSIGYAPQPPALATSLFVEDALFLAVGYESLVPPRHTYPTNSSILQKIPHFTVLYKHLNSNYQTA